MLFVDYHAFYLNFEPNYAGETLFMVSIFSLWKGRN